MHTKKILISLLFLSMFLASTGFTATQQSPVQISGQVSNGTPGATLPQAATLFLQFYNGSQVGSEYSTEMGPDGSFSFTDLEGEVGSSFVVFTEYLGVFYNSVESQLLSADNPPVELVIYETTNDPADIVISSLYLLIYPSLDEDTYQITEVYKVENSGQRTYIGSQTPDGIRTTFDWAPPAGAQNIVFSEAESRERYIANGQGYSDTYPIRPIPYYQEMDIAYDMPYAREVAFSNTFAVPLQRMVVSGNLTDILISGDTFAEDQLPEEQDYLNGVYSGGPFAAGEAVRFDILYSPNAHPSESAGAAAPSKGLNFDPATLALGLFALALAVFLSVMLFRQPNLPDCPVEIRPQIEKLAALETGYKKGQISAEDYQARKKKLTAALQHQTDQFLSKNK
ncbi:SHOCT domain-containing protein [Pelolinea submarina]|uniref:Oligomerization/nucleic acid binding protein n=1 Tax=Pelolinea submarina TaxID=913107 RepID=A0A347ZQQ9_9CHLR|nr:SHOCT domain-containing protein [Pelolinea submarina]REG11804.1 hypothetical protein DFR64_1697 [Pelolinea submarina]BBB47640.1 hypothetical protein Pelsub_P0867 [Pelolinea submarina]